MTDTSHWSVYHWVHDIILAFASVNGASRTKIEEVTLNALRTRQSLVKGERLVRTEVRAVLRTWVECWTNYWTSNRLVGRLKRFHPRSTHHGISPIVNACQHIELLPGACAVRVGVGLYWFTQEGMPHSAKVQCQRRQVEEAEASFGALSPHRKIDVKRELPVGSVSVFTLIRTDTTLDHSQKAEKVWMHTWSNWLGSGGDTDMWVCNRSQPQRYVTWVEMQFLSLS